jgi:hypothetical protein
MYYIHSHIRKETQNLSFENISIFIIFITNIKF